MRAILVAIALFVTVPVMSAPAFAGETSEVATNAAFRLKLVENAASARRASGRLAILAKQPAPAKMSASDRRLYGEQSKWLSDSAGKLASVHARMSQVLAKGDRAGVTEIATTSMELVTLRDQITAESKRFKSLKRNASAVSALH